MGGWRLALLGAAALVAASGCGRPAPRRPDVPRPPKGMAILPYEGRLEDEPRLAAAIRRLPAALDEARLQVEGALGVTLDRPDRLRVSVQDTGGGREAWAVTQIWTARIRTWHITIRSEPLARGDRSVDAIARAALAEAMLAEHEHLARVTLPGWVKAGAPLYVSRLGDARRRERRFSSSPDAPPDLALVGYTRWLYLERTFGPRRLARFLPAILGGESEAKALLTAFGRSPGALALEWALFETEWLAEEAGDAPSAPVRSDREALRVARVLLDAGQVDAAMTALERFHLLFPESDLAEEAHLDLTRLRLDVGDHRRVLEDLADGIENASGTFGTRVRTLALEAAESLGWDGRAAEILARETSINGLGSDLAKRAAKLSARSSRPPSTRQAGEIQTALETLASTDSSEDARVAARRAIRRIGRRAAARIERAAREDPRLAIEAVALLGVLGGPGSEEVLERLALEGGPEAARAAVGMLLRMGEDPRALGRRLLSARSAWPALRALRDATGRADRDLLDRVPDLAMRLADPDPAARVALARRLGDVGLAGGAAPLGILARSDPAGPVRETAVRALGRLGEAGLTMLEDLLADRRGPSRLLLFDVLLGRAPRRAAAQIPGLLADRSPRIRAGVLTALSAHGSSRATAAAIESLGDPDGGVRRVAAGVLVDGPADEVIPLVIAAYDTDPVSAERAVRLARVVGARAGRDFGHDPELDAAGRRAVAKRMRAWWTSARGE